MSTTLPSPLETYILERLSEHEMYGLELVAQSDGRLKRGSVYVTLGRMAAKGLIASRLDTQGRGIGLAKRLYRPTAEGLCMLDAVRAVRRLLR